MRVWDPDEHGSVQGESEPAAAAEGNTIAKDEELVFDHDGHRGPVELAGRSRLVRKKRRR